LDSYELKLIYYVDDDLLSVFTLENNNFVLGEGWVIGLDSLKK
jgi:hypothetical protein